MRPAAPNAQFQSFAERQARFDDWIRQNDPDSTKGWKWYQRWLEHHATRLQPDGKPVDPAVWYSEAIRVADWKSRQSLSQTRVGNWSPIGPNLVPDSPDPFSQHGMGRINCITFHPTDPLTFWVGIAQGGVWKTTNGGQSWLPLTDDLPILRISDIALDPNDTDIMYISVGDYAYMGVGLDLDARKRLTHYGLGVYKTTDGGQSWLPTGLTFAQTERDGSLTRRVFVDPANSQNLLAAGIHGIWQSADGGDNWSQVLDSLIWDIEQAPNDPNTLYASSGYRSTLDMGTAGILKSTDFGANWTWLNTGIPRQDTVQRVEIAISPSDPNYVYALTCDIERGFYGLYRSTDAGGSWEKRSAKGSAPNILHWYEGGTPNGGQGTYDLAILVDPNDRERIYTGGINMWASEDGGLSWNGVSFWRGDYGPSLHADQHQYAYNPQDDKFYVCNDGGLFRTDSIEIGSWDSTFNAGYQWPTQWEDLSDGIQATSFYRLGISLSAPDNVIAGAQDNSTFYYNNGTWSNIIGGDGMECLIDPTDPSRIYGTWQYGGMARSTNGGQSLEYGITNQIRFGTDEEGAWTTPFFMEPNAPLTLYVAFGNAWRSFDGGDTWTKLSDCPPMTGALFPAPASMIIRAPSDENVIYMSKRIYHQYSQPSELWRSLDGGFSWTNLSLSVSLPDSLFFNDLTVDDDDPYHLWLSLGGFVDGVKVFESTDAGDSWNNDSGSLPNLPVNTIIHQPGSPNNVLYAGLDIGVWYKSDTSDWQLYSENLPNVIVTELEINPSNQKLYASTFGRGLWRADLVVDENNVGIGPDLFEGMKVSVSPNPNDGFFRLAIEEAPVNELELEIVDIKGRVLRQEILKLQSGQSSETYQLDLAYGLYYLRLSAENRTYVEKILVE